MSFLDHLTQVLGGPQGLERLQRGEIDPDGSHDGIRDAVAKAPPDQLQRAIANAARQVDGNHYRDHITPGVGGTDPLGLIGGGSLASIATTLATQVLGGGGGGLDFGKLRDLIPGLRNTDPNQMSKDDVAVLADEVRKRDPDAFGRAATEIGRKDPNILQQLLGNKALLLAAAGLAATMLNKGQGPSLRGRPAQPKGVQSKPSAPFKR